MGSRGKRFEQLLRVWSLVCEDTPQASPLCPNQAPSPKFCLNFQKYLSRGGSLESLIPFQFNLSACFRRFAESLVASLLPATGNIARVTAHLKHCWSSSLLLSTFIMAPLSLAISSGSGLQLDPIVTRFSKNVIVRNSIEDSDKPEPTTSSNFCSRS